MAALSQAYQRNDLHKGVAEMLTIILRKAQSARIVASLLLALQSLTAFVRPCFAGAEVAIAQEIKSEACQPGNAQDYKSRRTFEIVKVQHEISKKLSHEILDLMKVHAETLAMDHTVNFTPQMDEWIQKNGRLPWNGIYSSEAQVWGYMNQYTTAMDSAPFRWLIHGSGYHPPEKL